MPNWQFTGERKEQFVIAWIYSYWLHRESLASTNWIDSHMAKTMNSFCLIFPCWFAHSLSPCPLHSHLFYSWFLYLLIWLPFFLFAVEILLALTFSSTTTTTTHVCFIDFISFYSFTCIFVPHHNQFTHLHRFKLKKHQKNKTKTNK